jgi:hypothetical protein
VVHSLQVFLLKFCMHFLSPYPSYLSRPAHSPRFGHPNNNIWWSVQIMKLLSEQFSPWWWWWSVALQPRPGLGLPLQVSWYFYSTMWGYQLHDRPIVDTLIQPSETSSSNYQRLSRRSRETRVRKQFSASSCYFFSLRFKHFSKYFVFRRPQSIKFEVFTVV